MRPITRSTLTLLLAGSCAPGALAADAVLPERVEQIVLHVLGGPSYAEGERRFVFYEPPRTKQLWKASFGTQWIVWTDGSLWPRHAARGEPAYWMPDTARPAHADARARLAREARPVYSHVHRANSRSVGIEVSHSGRRDAPFPPAQARAVAWLVRSLLEMSNGRLGPRAVVGHKDLDQRPAYVSGRCQRPGCPMFVDEAGRPYRRRVDPPEALFEALAREGLVIPRPANGDAELARVEGLGTLSRPAVAR